MDKFLPSFETFSREGLWYTQIFLVVFITLVFSFIFRRVLNKLFLRFSKTHRVWDDALIDALYRPLNILVWLLGISFASYILGKKLDAPIFEAVVPIRDVGVITIIAWFLWRLVSNVRANFELKAQEQGRRVDVTTADAVSKLLRASIVITSSLVVLQTLGFSISGVLAFGGIGGIAVGFAAKDMLANFFGGLMVYMDRPFEVGDWVRSPDRNIEGNVEHIGWRLTRIRTFDKRPLYIPNATFTSIAVENPSRMSNRRIYETIGVRYDDADKIRVILRDVEIMLKTHPDIQQDMLLMVNFNQFAASSLDFFIYTFTKTTRWDEYHRVKQDILLKIYDIIDGHGAQIAFPTSTVHLETEPSIPQAVQDK